MDLPRPIDSIKLILIFLVVLWLAIILNIRLIRPLVAFIYLTFIPGFTILNVVRVGDLDIIDFLLFSVGLSMGFVMLVGVLTNELLPIFGISEPLSEGLIICIVSGSTLLLCLMNLVVNWGPHPRTHFLEDVRTKDSEIGQTLMIFALVFLTVLGIIFVRVFHNNLLMITVLIMALVVFIIYLIFGKPNFRIYPVVLLGIGTVLLVQKSLVSGYINGFDIHVEYYIFRSTTDSLRWIPVSFSLPYASYSSMLSTTILPTIYSVFLGIEPTWVFKIIYPLIYSLYPIGLYQLHKNKIGKEAAFVSAFFFMCNYDVFLQPTSNSKQMIAGLFYVLLFITLFHKRGSVSPKMYLCLIVFSFGVTTAHYATSYLFLTLIAIVWLWELFARERNTRITTGFVLLMFTIAFTWYIFTPTSGPFDKIVNLGNQIYDNFLVELFATESRGRVVETIATGGPPSLLHGISRLLFYITLFFVFVGFATLVTRQALKNVDREYKRVIYSAVIMLSATIAVPNLAPAMAISRFYNLLLILFAPLFVLGVKMFSQNLLFLKSITARTMAVFLLIAIITPFYLFQTGIIYEIGGDIEPTNPSISIYRMGTAPYVNLGFVRESDVFGSKWVSTNINISESQIYSDAISATFVLTSYGLIPRPFVSIISNETLPGRSYVYLASFNRTVFVIQRWPVRVRSIDVSNITTLLPLTSNVYSNTLSEVRYIAGNFTLP